MKWVKWMPHVYPKGSCQAAVQRETQTKPNNLMVSWKERNQNLGMARGLGTIRQGTKNEVAAQREDLMRGPLESGRILICNCVRRTYPRIKKKP